jgi:hypothetical protein
MQIWRESHHGVEIDEVKKNSEQDGRLSERTKFSCVFWGNMLCGKGDE